MTESNTNVTSEKFSTWPIRISKVSENRDPGYDEYEDFIELLVYARIISEVEA